MTRFDFLLALACATLPLLEIFKTYMFSWVTIIEVSQMLVDRIIFIELTC